MFINWSLMLFLFGLFFLFLFSTSFYSNSFIILEYVFCSILSLDYKVYIMFDWMSCIFSSMVLLISSMVLMYSHDYMMSDKMKNSFCWMVIMFVLSMILLILMPNAFMLILGWDGLGLVSYLLVIFYQSTNSYNSGMMTIISNRIGDVMVIMMIIFVMNFGSFDLLSMMNLELICGMFVIIAGLTKSAQIPFSAWLPAAMAAPTPVSSLVHSSTLVTAGVYLLIRFDFLFEVEIFSKILLKISLFTMLMAGINAFFENDLKKIIAFSTLSQLSMMMVALSLNMTYIAFFHLIMHAIFKSMLFLGAGYVIHNMMGKQDIRMLSDFFSYSPVIAGCMLISTFSLMGIPFVGGFYSKDLILEWFFFENCNSTELLIFMLGVVFTFLYNMRMIFNLFLKGIFMSSMINYSFNIFMKIPIFFLTFFLLIIGNLFSWLLLPDFSMIFINKFEKLLSIMLLITVVIFYVIFMKFNFFFNKNFEFFMTMWFMSKLTSKILLTNNNFLLKLSISDWSWIEMLGPLGMKSMLTSNYKISFMSNNMFFAKIVMLSILFLMLF
nr:NADH dehydrogenase subunit 5 [Dermacentor rhinocerinus]QLD97136.1 NADH dehydrogenase subunit 5 [Dermacentor rhinocerinus]